jgi:simple sugar transport system permease protein
MKRVLAIDPRLVVLAVVFVLVAATLGWLRPEVFLSVGNIQSMLLQTSVIGVLSLAVALTMLTGGIDLSINATANLTSIVVASLLAAVGPAGGASHASPVVAALGVAAGLLVGAGCGLINGILIAVLGYSPILATLGTMTLFVGAGTVVTGGNTIFGISAFEAIGRGAFLGVPLPAIVFLLAALILSLLLEARRFGLSVYLFGANEQAARFCGIDVRGLITGVYVISGVLSAVAGLIDLGVTNSANVDFGSSYVLLAILISVLGGISPSGGAGRIVGVVLAVFILQFLSTGLNLLYQSSGSNFLKEFAWGATLLVVLAAGRGGFGGRMRAPRVRMPRSTSPQPDLGE